MSECAVTHKTSTTIPGFYGKLPARGDFVTRRLAQSLVQRWDRWLQDSLASSREQLGDSWLKFYLTAPIWRFVISPGVLDAAPVAGLLMASVDRVGRYFPLSLMVPVDETFCPSALALDATHWFGRAEEVLLTALEEGVEIEMFDQTVIELGMLAAPRILKCGTLRRERLLQRFALPEFAVDILYASIVDDMFRAISRDYCVWWTRGSEDVAATFLVSDGLPQMASFAAFLDGDWARWGWDTEEHPLRPSSTEEELPSQKGVS